MNYTIKQLATLAGVSVRTLHHYDQVGLLKPQRLEQNGYRTYGEGELLLLQQILFFRELDFPLPEIKKIISAPNFNLAAALREHRHLITLKQKRLTKLLKTIDATINKLTNHQPMPDQDLYGNFTKEEMDKYSEEAKQRWGNTDAYKQSTERVKKMGKEGLNKALLDSSKITVDIADCMKNGDAPTSTKVQELIAQHYNWLRNFYEPNLDIYRGLATMYVQDERFKANYENIATGLAQYMQDAMFYFADQMERSSK